MLRTVLIIILILVVIGALPLWPYSVSWGYAPVSGISVVAIIILLLLLLLL